MHKDTRWSYRLLMAWQEGESISFNGLATCSLATFQWMSSFSVVYSQPKLGSVGYRVKEIHIKLESKGMEIRGVGEQKQEMNMPKIYVTHKELILLYFIRHKIDILT